MKLVVPHYSISTIPAEQRKRDIAISLLEGDSRALSIQVLPEFHVPTTRASRTGASPHDLAAGLIESWSRFRIEEPNLERSCSGFFGFASRTSSLTGNSAILAADFVQGCGRILTGDLKHGQVVDGLMLVNPFEQARFFAGVSNGVPPPEA